MIDIVIDRNFSLNELLQLGKKGFKVLKTPHVGNQYMNNLIIAVLGFDILVYDRNIGFKDKNFHPQSVIFNTREEKIFSEAGLTIHSKKILIKTENSFINELLRGYTNPVCFHNHYFSLACNNHKISTYSEFLTKHKEKIAKIISYTHELFKDDWYRYVTKEQEVVNKTGYVSGDAILGLTHNDFGWIIPNIYNVLFHCVIDQKEGKVFLLSGPDMYKYICEYEERLSRSWSYIIKEIPSLPTQVQCLIIPVAKIRFAIPEKYKTYLDDVLNTYNKIKECEKRMVSDGTQNTKLSNLAYKQELVSSLKSIFQKRKALFESTIFYDIRKASSFSQYDLLHVKRLYVPEIVLTKKIYEIESMYDELLRYFKSSKYVNEV